MAQDGCSEPELADHGDEAEVDHGHSHQPIVGRGQNARDDESGRPAQNLGRPLRSSRPRDARDQRSVEVLAVRFRRRKGYGIVGDRQLGSNSSDRKDSAKARTKARTAWRAVTSLYDSASSMSHADGCSAPGARLRLRTRHPHCSTSDATSALLIALTSSLTILHLLAPAPVGGLETVVSTLAAAQRRAGHTVIVAPTLSAPGDGWNFAASLEQLRRRAGATHGAAPRLSSRALAHSDAVRLSRRKHSAHTWLQV